jgi:hypothetical protein
MDDRVDFEGARQKHAAWKTTIRDFLDDKISIEKERMVSHMHCDLGKWYYSEGKSKYGHMDTMKKFEFQHEKLHLIAKDIYELKIANDGSLPEWLEDELNLVSDKIVNLLTIAENEINN